MSISVSLKLWSADHRSSSAVHQEVRSVFGRKNVPKIISDTERMKSTSIYFCAKTACIDWPSTECRSVSYYHNFLSYNYYLTEYFKLLYKKNSYGNFNHRYHVSSIHLRAFLGVWNFTKYGWSACEPTAYEVVRDCRKFEKHWSLK
jgi:hypothetical protein